MAVDPVPSAASCGGWGASPDAQPGAGNGKLTLSEGSGLDPGHTVIFERAQGSAPPAWALPLSPGCEGPAGAVNWRAAVQVS